MTKIARIAAGAFLGLATSAQAATVQVDLVPCILAPTAIVSDSILTSDAYVISTFYKGYWGATQLAPPPPAANATLDLTKTETHGKCNVVYVGMEVTETQKLQLQDYSRTFKVRIVYLNGAGTSVDPEVNARLGISLDFTEPLVSAPYISLTADGAAVARVVQPNLTTDPRTLNLMTMPAYSTGESSSGNGTVSVIAEYVDEAGVTVPSSLSFPSVAAVAYTSNDGYEELHLFFGLTWFDVGSWAWAHFAVEWGTKGVFQGERRFYVAAMVDDLFLATALFEYDGLANEGPKERLTAADMENFLAFETSLNAQYGSNITTEWPFNGLGILDIVGSAYVFKVLNPSAGLLPKGVKVNGTGVDPVTPVGWLEEAVPGMAAELNAGLWAADDLLQWVRDNLDTFWWQSHTFSHLMRDDLGPSDCENEDTGLAQLAVMTGIFFSDNHNWRSFTPPGITGHFNKYCLATASANLMTCAPGDNTYDGINTQVSLVSNVSMYHSLYTTEAINGFTGFQIVPRYSTAVYFNCATGDCLVRENEYIRRSVCGCTNLDPSLDKGTCASCGEDIQSFGTLENLYAIEALTTTRYILMGRRDKYMFHQANVINNSDLPGGSLLSNWYHEIMASLFKYIAFPVTSKKFDDMCSEFALHEDLDGSGAVLTVTLDNLSGSISGVNLTASGTAGVIPLTVPSSGMIPTAGLTIGNTISYGSDTIYHISTSPEAIPTPASAPDISELAPVPGQPVINTTTTATPAPVAVQPGTNSTTTATPAPVTVEPGTNTTTTATPSPVQVAQPETTPTPGPVPAQPVPLETTPTPGPVLAQPVQPETNPTPEPVPAQPVQPETIPTPGPVLAQPVQPETNPTPGPVPSQPVQPETNPTPGPVPSQPETNPTPAPVVGHPVQPEAQPTSRSAPDC